MMRTALVRPARAHRAGRRADHRLAARPASPRLKRSVTVTSDLVRIGDLVENAGAAAQIADLPRARSRHRPAPFRRARCSSALAPHALIGIDTSGISEVLVTHASRAHHQQGHRSAHRRGHRAATGLVRRQRNRRQSSIGNSAPCMSRRARPRRCRSRGSASIRAPAISTRHLKSPAARAARRLPLRFSGKAIGNRRDRRADAAAGARRSRARIRCRGGAPAEIRRRRRCCGRRRARRRHGAAPRDARRPDPAPGRLDAAGAGAAQRECDARFTKCPASC